MSKKLTVKQKAKNKAAYKQIRKVWKERLESQMTYKQFKKLVLNEARGTSLSIKEAANKLGNSYYLLGDTDTNHRAYLTQAKKNLLTGMKENFRGTYDELRRKAGRFTKGEHLADKITWDELEDAYILTSSTGDKYAIRTDQSPKNMYLEQI